MGNINSSSMLVGNQSANKTKCYQADCGCQSVILGSNTGRSKFFISSEDVLPAVPVYFFFGLGQGISAPLGYQERLQVLNI